MPNFVPIWKYLTQRLIIRNRIVFFDKLFNNFSNPFLSLQLSSVELFSKFLKKFSFAYFFKLLTLFRMFLYSTKERVFLKF